ncbi:MAG: hypothetical protein Q7S21_01870 [archaeon]|nr:hypothetical protein [archaeon]
MSDTKNYLMLAMVAIVLVVSVVQAFQINSIKKELQTGNAIGNISLSASNDATSNAGGETYEQMMARMHPDQVQQTTQTSSSPQMVGGC